MEKKGAGESNDPAIGCIRWHGKEEAMEGRSSGGTSVKPSVCVKGYEKGNRDRKEATGGGSHLLDLEREKEAVIATAEQLKRRG